MKYFITALFLIMSCLIVEVHPQITNTEDLKLTLSSKGRFCLGEPFVVTATLENKSTRSRRVDPKALWLSFTVIAEDRHDAPKAALVGKNTLLVSIPESSIRIGGAPPVWSSQLPGRLLTLAPYKTLSVDKIFDPLCDTFFYTPGRYSIEAEYVANLADPEGKVNLDGEARAPDFVFTVARCD